MRTLTAGGLVALMALSTTAFGQDDGERPFDGDRPEREREQQRQRDGERPGPRGGERPGPRGLGAPAPMLMFALDRNRDGELSAEEVDQAVAALKKLDRNEDGVIDRDELRPRPTFDAEFGRPGRGDRPRGPRPEDADRPRGEGEHPQRERERAGREDADRGPRGDDERGPRPEGARGPRPDGERGPRGGGPGGPGGPRMDPERFVDRLMESDADGDGKLSREELLKAVQNFRGGRGRGPGPGGGRGDREGGSSDRPERPE